ncbi:MULTISPECIES: XRE family transcriptional regulator [unclassified Sphingomonas]|uniref:XRE family transcriptional regulator n=1 Tax=unclassified Sphingomonas TaxID=196159 RepID=UPI00226A1AC0|nr:MULTISPECIES: XRE family transcriptional regulator [unclassified Sphingomonas]
MNAPEILKERISAKLAELNVTAREISLAAVGQPDAIRNIIKKGSMPGIDRLDAIAEHLSTTADWLLGRESAIERTGGGGDTLPLATLRRLPKTLPIYGSALGADIEYDDEHGVVVKVEQTEVHMAEPIDYMARPTGIAGRSDMYVVVVSGHSMEPRFDSGRRYLIDPRRTPVVGDDVVVQLRAAIFDGEEVTHVLIKQLVRRKPGAVVLRQFNPHTIFEVPNEQVSAVHRVMPWDEALGF